MRYYIEHILQFLVAVQFIMLRSQSLLTSLGIWLTVVALVTVLIYVRVMTAMTVVTGDRPTWQAPGVWWVRIRLHIGWRLGSSSGTTSCPEIASSTSGRASCLEKMLLTFSEEFPPPGFVLLLWKWPGVFFFFLNKDLIPFETVEQPWECLQKEVSEKQMLQQLSFLWQTMGTEGVFSMLQDQLNKDHHHHHQHNKQHHHCHHQNHF